MTVKSEVAEKKYAEKLAADLAKSKMLKGMGEYLYGAGIEVDPSAIPIKNWDTFRTDARAVADAFDRLLDAMKAAYPRR